MNYQFLGGPKDGEWIALPDNATELRISKLSRIDEVIKLGPDDTLESLTFGVPIRGQYLDWYEGLRRAQQ